MVLWIYFKSFFAFFLLTVGFYYDNPPLHLMPVPKGSRDPVQTPSVNENVPRHIFSGSIRDVHNRSWTSHRSGLFQGPSKIPFHPFPSPIQSKQRYQRYYNVHLESPDQVTVLYSGIQLFSALLLRVLQIPSVQFQPKPVIEPHTEVPNWDPFQWPCSGISGPC